MICKRVKFCYGGGMNKNKGFTLIELMVTLAIFAIIAAMAAPSFGKMVTRQKLNSNTRAFVSAFNLAKSQAATLRAPVAVCPNKTPAGLDYTLKKCAEDAIPNYAALNDADQANAQANRVILVAVDKNVELKSGSTTKVVFNEVGSSGSEQTMSLCAGKELRTLTILALGNVTQTTGTC